MLSATPATHSLFPSGDRSNLTPYLSWIWKEYFYDIPRVNGVTIDYCYPWKSKLGLIRLSEDRFSSFIGINTLLQLQQVPEDVLLTTIAHELTHYAHGFGSPLPRRCQHPHANGVVDRELEQRDLGPSLHRCKEWVDKNWYTFYDMHRPHICATRSRRVNIKRTNLCCHDR